MDTKLANAATRILPIRFRLLNGDTIPCLRDILDDPELNQPLREVIPRLVWQGRTTLLAAREKDGKSTLASAAAAAVSNGGDFLGLPTTPGRVLWVGLEEHVADVAHRLDGFGAHPDHVVVISGLPDWLDDLAHVALHAKPSLIVIDTLAALAAGKVRDGSSSAEWAPIMGSLTRAARQTNAGFLIIAHARKSDGQYRDSSAIGAGVDHIVEMQPGAQSDRRVLSGKGRYGVSRIEIAFDGEKYTIISAPAGVTDRVLAFVRNNPGCSQRAIRKGVGGNAGALDAEVGRLLELGRLEDHGTSTNRRYHLMGAVSGEELGNREQDTVSQETPLRRGADILENQVLETSSVPIAVAPGCRMGHGQEAKDGEKPSAQ